MLTHCRVTGSPQHPDDILAPLVGRMDTLARIAWVRIGAENFRDKLEAEELLAVLEPIETTMDLPTARMVIELAEDIEDARKAINKYVERHRSKEEEDA